MFVRGLGVGSQALALSVFGAGEDLDAFLVAFILPSLIVVPYGAAVELAWGPDYARVREAFPGADAALRGQLLVRVISSGIIATALAIVASPALVRMSAPAAGQGVVRIAQDLAWWVYPTILPGFVVAACTTMLVAGGRLHVPILVQAVRPIALAVAAGWARTIEAMAVAALLGAVGEMVIGLILVRRLEGRADLRLARRSAGKGRVGALSLSALITQGASSVDQIVVSSLGSGSLAVYSVAARFYDVGKAALLQPSARLAQNRLAVAVRDPRRWTEQVRFELRRATQGGIVAAVVVALAGPALIFVVFRHGEFSARDATRSGCIAALLALALLPWAIATVQTRALIIRGRISTQLRLAVVFLALNAGFDLILAWAFGVYGVALGTGLALVALMVLQRRVLDSSEVGVAGTPLLQHEDAPERSGHAQPSGVEASQEEGDDAWVEQAVAPELRRGEGLP